MKKAIIDLGNKYGLEITVEYLKRGFDIHGYEISGDGLFFFDEYFSGKTSNGVEYKSDKDEFLERVEAEFRKYQSSPIKA